MLKYLADELPKYYKTPIIKQFERLKKIVAAIEKIRDEKFKLADDIALTTCADVVEATTNQVSKEILHALGQQARKEREKRFAKTLTKRQQKAIIDGQGIDGATIGEWFHRWQRADLERIASVVQRASVEEMTVAGITKLIRGTKENNYSDGILSTTQVSAVRLARTLINGVCNNARVETIKENSDVVDGVKFIGTLDGKTCPHCAAHDGHIWRGEEMNAARRPPLHPNCRCTLVPYVELRDDDGNIVDVDSDRPAANADFDALAKEAYNQKANENGWKRRFDDLSPSTRLKYYYQAQKDYEKETGKPAYRQVDSGVDFKEYFKKQPEEFQRQWLGKKRFEAYKSGALTEETLFNPDLGFTIDRLTLFDFIESDNKTATNEIESSSLDIFSVGREEVEGEVSKRTMQLWDIFFPKNELYKSNLKKTKRIRNVRFSGRAKKNQELKKGIAKGLDFVARICGNYGIDLDELNDVVISSELDNNRAGYDIISNSVILALRDKTEGENSVANDLAHEFGHVVEHNVGGELKRRIIDYYESISLKDSDGDYLYITDKDGRYQTDDDWLFRELAVKVPDYYIQKEYVDYNGIIRSTEILSVFFEIMYSKPHLKMNPDYGTFFNEVENILIESFKSKVSHEQSI